MSIRTEVKHRIKEGRLFSVEPSLDSDPVERLMVVSPEINGLLAGPWDSRAMETLHPYEARDAFFGLLDPERDGV